MGVAMDMCGKPVQVNPWMKGYSVNNVAINVGLMFTIAYFQKDTNQNQDESPILCLH